MEWKPIKKFNGLYLVSDTGLIFSCRKGEMLKLHISNTGYARVDISINGVLKHYSVHRLVAEAFIPNPDGLPVVNHKDENPLNNSVDNLEWCTYKYNSNYGTCIERRVNNTNYTRGGENPKSKEVYQFDMNGKLINKFLSVADAADQTGLNRKSIAKACLGNLKKYSECVWSYDGTFQYNSHKHYKNRKGTIQMLDLNGVLVKEYNSPDEMREDGLSPSHVNRVCRGERKTYKGYVFKST